MSEDQQQQEHHIVRCARPRGEFFFRVTGESHYQDELRTLAAAIKDGKDPFTKLWTIEDDEDVPDAEYVGNVIRQEDPEERTFTVLLVPEPNNAYDPNAIVVMDFRVEKVGYFPKADAAAHHEWSRLAVERGCLFACRAALRGGEGDKESYGVYLNIKTPAGMLRDLRQAIADIDAGTGRTLVFGDAPPAVPEPTPPNLQADLDHARADRAGGHGELVPLVRRSWTLQEKLLLALAIGAGLVIVALGLTVVVGIFAGFP